MNDLKEKYIWIFTLLYFIFIPTIFFGQEKDDFESLRLHILSELSARDIQQAFSSLDTLEALAETRRQEIQTEMVRAILHYQQGDKNTALGIAMDAEQCYRKNRNYSDQISAIGFIASNFRELGLHNEALFYLDKAKRSIKKLPEGHLKGQYGTLVHHESIGIYTRKKDYKKVNESIQQAYDYVESIQEGEQKNFFLATTIKHEADNEHNLGNYSKSKELYNKALEVLGTKTDLLYGMIILEKAVLALKQEKYNTSFDYLKEVDTISKGSQFFLLKGKLSKAYMDYYEAVGDSVNYDTYRYQYLSTIHQNDGELKDAANKALSDLRSKIAANKRISLSFGAIATISIVILGLIVVFMYRRNRRQTTRFNYVVEQLQNGKLLESQVPSDIGIDSTPAHNNTLAIESAISDETEERILASLVILEQESKFFTHPKLNLSRLASELNTNTKYLAYVIRKHRKKNFNTYINDLRVNYSLKLLQKDSKYLQYKISYLAEIVGFSTHSKFSSEFKRVVGISPSVYVSKMSK